MSAQADTSTDAVTRELGALVMVLEDVYPDWFEETLATLDDGSGYVTGSRCLPIMAAIKLIRAGRPQSSG